VILARASAALTPPLWQAPQEHLTGKRLLVVEDNAVNCRLIQHRATHWGMSVDLAATPEEALRLARTAAEYDAAIIDLQLPPGGGLDLAEALHEVPSCSSLPIVLLSSVRIRGDDSRPLTAGVVGMIYKPIRPAQLLDTLCRALSVQVHLEKRRPFAPVLDPRLARRLPLRLLLADDNPINQKVGLSVLRKLGYHADVATNGLEVLKALEQKAYDLLFLDVQMPEMDGLEAARQICSRWPREKRPRIVAMTGNALAGDREKCLDAGMDDYISKPIRVNELQAALERWGPLSTRKSDTAFLSRKRSLQPEDVLDSSVLAELESLSGDDDSDMLRELVDIFIDSAPRRITQISQAIADPERLGFHAHALKSMGLNLGAKQIVQLSEKLEKLAREGKTDFAPSVLNDLQAAFTQTKARLLELRGF
jgi:CheY-like chemotaxis protein/HPt (histidine-containing phosphotransfer) domain-containing protein